MSKEQIEKAKWYLQDDEFTGFNSDVRKAVRIILEYVKELEEREKEIRYNLCTECERNIEYLLEDTKEE